MVVNERQRDEQFVQFIQAYNPYLGIIFANTRDQADLLGNMLNRRGVSVDVLHGDLQQRQRKQVLQKFREAKIQFLVASDLAARGLDIEGVTHVFNYEFPRDLSWFIHRIGRTGRAGETGIAITLFTSKDLFKLTKVEKALGRRMKQMELVDGELKVKSRTLKPLLGGAGEGKKNNNSRQRMLVTDDGEVWSTKKPLKPNAKKQNEKKPKLTNKKISRKPKRNL
jgi:ATP-dependent RNA helicase DeaD